jgi:Rieske Fe-S protein
MERREFIRKGCLLCAGAAGLGLLATQLSSCAPLTVVRSSLGGQTATVALDSFKEQPLVIVRDNQAEFDILVVKRTEEQYNAMLMKCTHQAQPLTANKTGLFCPSHGSAFDLDGHVTKEPALKDLTKYKTSIENQQLIIHLNQTV